MRRQPQATEAVRTTHCLDVLSVVEGRSVGEQLPFILGLQNPMLNIARKDWVGRGTDCWKERGLTRLDSIA
jgi:hypothetical protein